MRILLTSIIVFISACLQAQQPEVTVKSPEGLTFDISIPKLNINDTALSELNFSGDPGEYDFALKLSRPNGAKLNSQLRVVEDYKVEYHLLDVKGQLLLAEHTRTSLNFGSPETADLEAIDTMPDSVQVGTETVPSVSLPCVNRENVRKWQALSSQLDDVYFEKDRLGMASDMLNTGDISVTQFINIARYLDYEDSRLELLSTALPRICDTHNLEQLYGLFELQTSREKLDKLLSGQ